MLATSSLPVFIGAESHHYKGAIPVSQNQKIVSL